MHTIARVLIGVLFIFSAISKLYPIEPFEYKLVELGLINWLGTPVFARFIIAVELFLGLCILLGIWYKHYIYYATQILLLLFTFFLGYLWYKEGGDADCGCFGEWLKLTPLQSILKNLASIIVLFFLKKHYYHWCNKWMLVGMFIFSLAFPVVVNPMGFNTIQGVNRDEKIDFSGLPDTYLAKDKVDFQEGNKLVAFLKVGCGHCENAAKKLQIIGRKNQSEAMYFVIGARDEDKLKAFIAELDIQVPIVWMNDDSFFKYSGGRLPAIVYIEEGRLKKRWTGEYFNVEELTAVLD